LINDFDIILDLQLVQALASNGNVVLCKFKASSVVSVLHGVSGDLSRLSNQRNLLSYIRFVATYHRPEDTGAGHEVFYTTYLRFSQAIQDQLTATARHHWRSRLRPHLSLEARSSLGTMIINKGMRFGDPVLGLAIANDDHWDA
jgi:hypothetical protein